jgi:UDP:flavonoid glycosyltransferase YjiC (YdhE family)
VLARALVHRGHDVRVLGPPGPLAERFGSEGVDYRASDATLPWRPEAHRALAEEVAEHRMDVAVVDYMLPAALSGAEAAGVPGVAFVHTLFRDLSPIHMAADVDGTNALRAALGLAAVERLPQLVEKAPLVLVTTLEELDRPESVPANVRYVGPLVEGPGPDEGWQPPGRPLVVVSLGTTPMDEGAVLQRVLDALHGAPVHVVATLGPHLRAEELRPSPNATLTGYVRHTAVLPHADLYLNHGGLGSIGAALTCGVPLVCLPLGRDQPVNAEAVVAVGAGRALPPDAPADRIRATVLEVLGDDACRRTVARLAGDIRALDGPTTAAEGVESLLG